jgi:hypothetical protein
MGADHLRLCARHNLHFGEGRGCVLCRRERAQSSRHLSTRRAATIVGFSALALGLAALAMTYRRDPAAAPHYVSLGSGAASTAMRTIPSRLVNDASGRPAQTDSRTESATIATPVGAATIAPGWEEPVRLGRECNATPRSIDACMRFRAWCSPDEWSPAVKTLLTSTEQVEQLVRACDAEPSRRREYYVRLCLSGSALMCRAMGDLFPNRPISPPEACAAGDAGACRTVAERAMGTGHRAADGGIVAGHGPRNCGESLFVCMLGALGAVSPDICMHAARPCRRMAPQAGPDDGCCPDACITAYERARVNGSDQQAALEAVLASKCDPRPEGMHMY